MTKKTKLLIIAGIIAGPQSSGKTTVFNLLKKKIPHATFIPEINQYTVVSKRHMGAAFVGHEVETEIGRITLQTIKSIHKKSKKLAFMETGIFHLAYLDKSSGEKVANAFLKKYLAAHKNLDPVILFIDTKPDESFRRRKEIYLKRIRDARITDPKTKRQMLSRYKKHIFDMYPYWIKYFKKIPFRKIMIENSRKNYDTFIEEIHEVIKTVIA